MPTIKELREMLKKERERYKRLLQNNAVEMKIIDAFVEEHSLSDDDDIDDFIPPELLKKRRRR